MPGFPLTVGSVAVCFHQAPALMSPAQTAVLVQGQPVITLPAQIGVVGCPFNLPAVAQPCVKIQWIMVSTKVLVQTQPVLLMPPPFAPPGPVPAPGVCLGPLPQGVPAMKANQIQVVAL